MQDLGVREGNRGRELEIDLQIDSKKDRLVDIKVDRYTETKGSGGM